MMNLKTECKAVGISVADLSELLDVPYNTLNKWTKSRPQLLQVVFDGIRAKMLVQQLKEFNVITSCSDINNLNDQQLTNRMAHGECSNCGDAITSNFTDDYCNHCYDVEN